MGIRSGVGKGRQWRSDWLVGLLISVSVMVLHQTTDLFNGFERWFYDFASTSTLRQASDKVVILAIDDQSIANIGRWPWSRDVHAKVIDQLTKARAKTIVNTTFFFEPQTDRGLEYIHQIKEVVSLASSDDVLADRLSVLISNAEQALDADGALALSLKKAGNVVLPAVFENGAFLGRPDSPLPESAVRFGLPLSRQAYMDVRSPLLPLSAFGDAALAVGHLNQRLDPTDGHVRADPVFVNFAGQLVPSISLVAAMHSLNLPATALRTDTLQQVGLGGIRIPVDAAGFMYPQFYRDREGRTAFVTDSLWDLYSGKISGSKYAGKIVVIGATAVGIGEQFATPISLATTPAALVAHTTSSILNGHFFELPDWGVAASLSAAVLMTLYLMLAVPRLNGKAAALVTSGLLLILAITEYVALVQYFVWIPLVAPMAVLSLGYLGMTTKRFVVAEAGKLRSDEESAETNRLMGLALQGQGQLDMAFDRFMRASFSEAVMDNLMNLALDFERKRQFNKAQAVYEHMSAFNRTYKDLPLKLKRVKALADTVMLGGSGAHRGGGALLLNAGNMQKPMLGRYQVEKELGKGAMGVVYLGKDLKIGRTVAIKTLGLSQEFEGAELDDARQRFFREAETAGRLQHQNIVTIFDAGEDHDLAYIAMEFLKGQDLVHHARHGHLLPVHVVVSICAKVADALAYAHTLNVVHRDIKPANVMYDPTSETVKVTDFGIARVTDASRTKTGMVLGTPSFMSPEQIAGKPVAGQSDIYSLGVMLFQLLTGELPFRGESLAELMFKITNVEAASVLSIRPELSLCLGEVVAKALAKSLGQRYATSDEMAADLRACLLAEGSMKAVPVSPEVAVAHKNRREEQHDPVTDTFATTSVMAAPEPVAALSVFHKGEA